MKTREPTGREIELAAEKLGVSADINEIIGAMQNRTEDLLIAKESYRSEYFCSYNGEIGGTATISTYFTKAGVVRQDAIVDGDCMGMGCGCMGSAVLY